MERPAAYDLIVIGGGINGTGIARDAAGRGLTVALVEQGDLASATSSVSSKLVHGGLRYLERYHFRQVRECLREREVLLRAAPHLVSPLRFVLPLSDRQRPAALIRAGLFLYDHLGGESTLPKSEWVDLRTSPFGQPLRPETTRAAVYSDCQGNDCRLVVANAVDAVRLGCDVMTRTRVVRIVRRDDPAEGFDVHVVEGARGGTTVLRA
ncbi:MAG: FAD-dependent oxidoreductase, partial [Alphaproteobacteria bacterium]|nr:FAD-dependent oxidoreductase [Alphaproteobacteria bacterium]